MPAAKQITRCSLGNPIDLLAQPRKPSGRSHRVRLIMKMRRSLERCANRTGSGTDVRWETAMRVDITVEVVNGVLRKRRARYLHPGLIRDRLSDPTFGSALWRQGSRRLCFSLWRHEGLARASGLVKLMLRNREHIDGGLAGSYLY